MGANGRRAKCSTHDDAGCGPRSKLRGSSKEAWNAASGPLEAGTDEVLYKGESSEKIQSAVEQMVGGLRPRDCYSD
jgi:hypothetical protein